MRFYLESSNQKTDRRQAVGLCEYIGGFCHTSIFTPYSSTRQDYDLRLHSRERNLISQRTKKALARKRAEGVVLGRPKGRKNSPEKYKLFGKEILIKEGIISPKI